MVTLYTPQMRSALFSKQGRYACPVVIQDLVRIVQPGRRCTRNLPVLSGYRLVPTHGRRAVPSWKSCYVLIVLSRFRKKWFIAVMLLLACVTGVAVLLRLPARNPTLEYSLISPPTREPNEAVFYISSVGSANDVAVTQNCYRAEFEIKNLGPCSVVFPYRGWFSLEIQKSNSTEWHSANQPSLGILHPPIRPGSAQKFRIRIPAEASRWRITATYRRYQLPVQIVNWIARDILRSEVEFGDRKDYDAVGPIWEIPPTPKSQEGG